MSDLMQCPACGGKVSTQAKACPHCGHPVTPPVTPNQGGGDGCLIIVGIVVLVFLAGCLLSWCQEKKDPKKASSRSSDGSIIMQKTQIGCVMMNDFLRLSEIGSSGDDEAYSKMRAALIGAGRCGIIPKDSVVFLDDTNYKHNLSKVRVKGTTTGLWTKWIRPW